MRILVAEDERDLNRIITQKLTADGYSVDSCLNGTEAIDCLSFTDYDAVILDIMMPGADGYAVLASLRNAERSRKLYKARDSALFYMLLFFTSSKICEKI